VHHTDTQPKPVLITSRARPPPNPRLHCKPAPTRSISRTVDPLGEANARPEGVILEPPNVVSLPLPSAGAMAPHEDSAADLDSIPLTIIFDTDDEDVDVVKKPDDAGRDTVFVKMNVPVHPIKAMQGAFVESMHEASGASTPSTMKSSAADPALRRRILLDQDQSEETHAARWHQRPGQQYHELWKLMSQISFGVYLLLYGIAKDNDQVAAILQGHVDEVDEFLQTTLEDFDLALKDVDERLKFLKLPLENVHVFDAMLADRDFRRQIVDGNERIEHIIHRTAAAMKDALKDVEQGLSATKEFTKYLQVEREDHTEMQSKPDIQRIYDAMKCNADGWRQAFVSLQTKGNHLGVALVQLGSIVAEMDRRAGAISRKTRVCIAASSVKALADPLQFSVVPVPGPASPVTPLSPASSPPSSPRQPRQSRQAFGKHLPENPNMITPAIRATLPAFQYVQDRERTPEPTISSRNGVDSPTLEPSPNFRAELEEDLSLFTLQPRVYTPAPSPSPSASPKPRAATAALPVAAPAPAPAPAPVQIPAAATQVNRKSSLRQRFSLKRKGSLRAARMPDSRPMAKVLTPPTSGGGRKDSAYGSDSERINPSRASPDTFSTRSLHTRPSQPNLRSHNPRPSLSTRPSMSNLDPPSRPTLSHRPSEPNLARSFTRPELQTRPLNPYHPFQNHPIPSPLSEKHFNFQPVQASPHSPLQRPWTAAEEPPLHAPRHVPSAMGMSMMSAMTTDSKGQKVKKKRSGFGWLKKAFSLSEEEKAAFEARRRGNEMTYTREEVRPRFLDGKRIDRDRGDGRSFISARSSGRS
jgi:hypothetical protein